MTPSEAFLTRILDYVKTAVAPDLVEPVTKATAEAIAVLMSDPFFTAELRIVADLRQENQWLKSQVIQLQRMIALSERIQAYFDSPEAKANFLSGYQEAYASQFLSVEEFKKRETFSAHEWYGLQNSQGQLHQGNASGQTPLRPWTEIEEDSTEVDRICIWCGCVCADVEDLEGHEAECEP